MADALKISVYILTFNNERTIERALKSVANWAEEIVVVDSFSSDSTLDIVRRYTSKVIQRQWPGFQAQYQFAHDQCQNDWRMFIDADEEISEKLQTEIRQFLIQQGEHPQENQVLAARIPRRTFYLGRWIRHGSWIPDREIRLTYKKTGSWSHGLHSALEVSCPVINLEHVIYHYTYRNIGDQLNTINKYSEVDSDIQLADGKKPSLRKMLLNPLWRIFVGYVFKGGFLDGIPGCIVAVATGFYVFAKYAKLWEKYNIKKELPQEGFYSEKLD